MKHKSFLLLLVLLLTTIATHAYDFQSGDLYYTITSNNTVEVTYQEYLSESNYQGLTTATIPETVTYDGTTYSVTSIGNYTFYRCTSLTSITIGNSVTSIGYEAFYECSALTSITLSNSVTSIVNIAFYGCSALTSITIPNSITSIGSSAFYYCSALTSIVVESGNTMYDSRENCNAIIETATNTLIVGCQSTTIPNSVTSIGRSAFSGCSSLTSVTIPNSVTSIGNGAFQSCFSLTSIVVESGNTMYDSRENCNAIIETATNTLIAGCQSTIIPNSVTTIGDYAFYGCSSLTSITIPNSVTSIGWAAFAGCSSLTSITCLAQTPPTCSSNSFSNVPRTIPLYVPAESVEAYKAADTWKEFDVQALSTDATLSSLTYDGKPIPSFDAGTLHYTVVLPSETSTLPQVDAVANDSGATLTIHQAAALPGEASVEVLAADNTTRQTYTIYFSKKSTPTDISDRPDSTGTDSDKGAEKLLRNGQVLIIRNGKTYNMMGQRL